MVKITVDNKGEVTEHVTEGSYVILFKDEGEGNYATVIHSEAKDALLMLASALKSLNDTGIPKEVIIGVVKRAIDFKSEAKVLVHGIGDVSEEGKKQAEGIAMLAQEALNNGLPVEDLIEMLNRANKEKSEDLN